MSKKSGAELDLTAIRDQINKKFGANKIALIGSDPIEKHPTISSGSIAINYALNGGWALGKIIEIFGENQSGKTTIALHAIFEAQKLGQRAAFIDMEHALNLEYAETLGVDVKNLLHSQPDTGEEALGIAEELVRLGIEMICFDSVAAMIPKSELEGEYGESKMGLHSRMMSQGMRKITGVANKAKATLIFINQTRLKIGVVFGDPTTTTGGEAMKFYSSQRIHILASTKLKDENGEIYGQETTVKVVKNKIGKPHIKVKINIIYGQGIDSLGEIIDVAVDLGIIEKKGSFFSYEEHKLGQGINNLRKTLSDNPELLEEIKKKSLI